ncbi:MAG: tripartite tricarboxylate transporter TctB family protein [bacterium]
MNKTARVYELLACVVLAIYSLVMIIHAYLNPVTTKVTGLKSYTFPVATYAIMLGICIILIVLNLVKERQINKTLCTMSKDERSQMDDKKREQYLFQRLDKRVVITIGMIIAYAVGWNILGFSLSTLLFVTLEAKILNKGTSWASCFLVALVAVVLVYGIFVKLFAISLPEPLLNAIFG